MRNTAYFFVIAIATIAALIYGQNLMVPFILGMLLWFVMRSLKQMMNKLGFVKKYFPSWLKTLLSSGIIAIVLISLFHVLSNNITELSQAYSKYEQNIDSVIGSINSSLNLNIVEVVKNQLGDFDFGGILSSVFSSISGLISNSFMIIIYALFILLEESNFGQKLNTIYANNSDGRKNFVKIVSEIENSVSEYFRIKAFVSLITCVLSYIALMIIGVDSPAFWAFLIFILNFIPTIGSLIATSFPAIFALLQFGEVFPFVMVLAVVGLIQLLVGNVLEPRLLGSTMNISPLVTILALSLWGSIWGVMGMLLSVPITVIMIIVFSHFEKTKPIAILLSEKGILKTRT